MKRMFELMPMILLPVYAYAQLPKNNVEDRSSTFQTSLIDKIIPVATHTFGYKILADTKLIIHQNCMPSVQFNNGLKTKISSKKTNSYHTGIN